MANNILIAAIWYHPCLCFFLYIDESYAVSCLSKRSDPVTISGLLCSDWALIAMSDGRKRLSGAEYRKNARIRREKQTKEIEQTGKIDLFFTKPVATSSTKQVEEVREDVTDDVVATCSYDTSEATSSIVRETEASESGAEPPSSSRECDDPVVLLGVSSDPAEWDINDSTRDHVAKHGIVQNENLDFTQSRRLYADKARVLTKHLFEKKKF